MPKKAVKKASKEKVPAKKKVTYPDVSQRRIPVKVMVESPEFIPMYKSKNSAAADLIANIPADLNGQRVLKMTPGTIAVVDTGISLQIPEGFEAQIRTKRELATSGISVVNSPATVDDDTKGKLQVVLMNTHRTEIVNIKHGDRFAQLVLKPVWYFQWNIVEQLEVSQ